MKSLFKILSLFVALTIFGFGNAKAQSAAGNFKLEIEQEVVDTTLYLDFFIEKTSGSDFKLGSSNFAVYVNEENLHMDKMFKVDSLIGRWDQSFDPTSYIQMGLGGEVFVHLAVRKRTAGSGLGQLVNGQRQLIGRVGVPIKNPCGTNSCQWVTVPVAITDFSGQNIKQNAQFVNTASAKDLCDTPDAPVIASTNGKLSFCQGEQLTLNAGSTDAEIKWYKDGNEIPGADGSSLVVSEAGQYHAEAVNCACTNAAAAVTVEMGTAPAKPMILQSSNNLIASLASSYQWYLNGQPIPNANKQIFVPNQPGNYSVEVFNDCGSAMSDEMTLSITGLEGSIAGVKIEAAPNPYMGDTRITYTIPSGGDVSVEVFDIMARKVATLYAGKQAAGTHEIKFGASEYNQSAGVYFARITYGGGAKTLKLIEQ